MTYIFEKNISMPICAFYKNNYINYLTGEILSSTYFNNKKYGIGSFQNLKLYRVAMVISSTDKIILPDFSKEVV